MSQQIPAAALKDPALLLQYPAMLPPPGVTPNFTNPENKGQRLVIVGAVLLALVFVFLANRAYTKIYIIQKVAWDDLTVFLAALGAIVSYAMCVWEIRKGVMGVHQYDLRIGELTSAGFRIPSDVISTTSGPTLWVTKFTFCLLYLQIFRPMRWLRISIYVVATICTAFYLATSLALVVLIAPESRKTPLEQFFSTRGVAAARFGVPIGAGGLVIDIWLFILPLVAIYKLQLHTARRIGLTLIFSTGLIAVAASAVSVYFRYIEQHTEDETWSLLNLELMYLVEIDAGIITASMPSFARMLHHHLPPWSTLKSRLKSITSASLSKSSKSNLVTKSSGLPHSNDVYYGRNSPYINRSHKNGTNSSPEYEMEHRKSVRAYIRGARPETGDDDRVYLKLDP